MATGEIVSNPQAPLTQFKLPDQAIAAMTDQFMPLTIRDVNDTAGFEKVHKARMVVKGHRVEVEKVRKVLKADALEYGRRVDAEAKRITGLLEPIEDHLSQQEDAYTAEKEKIRNAARLAAEAEERARQEAEAARIKAEHDAEVERLQVERERLKAERARQRAEQDRIDADRRKVEEEQRRLAEIEATRLRKLEEERIATAAAEKAKIETEQRLAREAEQRAKAEKEAAEAAEAARVRAEALRPDREKLMAVATAISEIKVPAVSVDLAEIARQVQQVLTNASIKIRSIVGATCDLSDLV